MSDEFRHWLIMLEIRIFCRLWWQPIDLGGHLQPEKVFWIWNLSNLINMILIVFFPLLADDRVQNWPLMKSPVITLIICSIYVIIVKLVGPAFMRNREPFNLRWIMVLYNFIMASTSLFIFYKLGYHGWFGKYNYKCQPVDYSDSSDAIGVSLI